MSDLQDAVVALQDQVYKIENQISERYYQCDPDLETGGDGRYLLLEARTALVLGLAAVENSAKSGPVSTEQPLLELPERLRAMSTWAFDKEMDRLERLQKVTGSRVSPVTRARPRT